MVPKRRICPSCGGKKDFYAKLCRPCSPKQQALLGRKGPNHPAWKGGFRIDEDGYVKTYDPNHPWPRRGGYVFEHVRVMELHLGRRLDLDETVHHINHQRQDNRLENLEVKPRGEHSSHHRKLDSHLRKRDRLGRFASGEVSA